MGMYTEIFFRATLRKDVPEEVVNVLKYMVSHDNAELETLPEHALFNSRRWTFLGGSWSYYFPRPAESKFIKDEITGQWCLALNANIKNYGNEIRHFFDWIDPYVHASEGEFLGYELYEEDTVPLLYNKK